MPKREAFAAASPPHNTFRRVFMLIDPDAFEAGFTRWVGSLVDRFEREVVAIDGKAVWRSFDRGREQLPLHVVSAWASELGVVLGHSRKLAETALRCAAVFAFRRRCVTLQLKATFSSFVLIAALHGDTQSVPDVEYAAIVKRQIADGHWQQTRATTTWALLDQGTAGNGACSRGSVWAGQAGRTACR